MRKPILKYKRHQDCPDADALHTKEPVAESDYLGWCRWVDKIKKTHRQKRCPTCGFWRIWVKKQLAGEPAKGG